MSITASKSISLLPAAGLLDLRSEAARIALGHRRIVLNKQVRDQGKECRAGGMVKLFSESVHGFNNQDLHDQQTAPLDPMPPYIWNAEEDPLGTIAPDSMCALATDRQVLVCLGLVNEGCAEAPTFLFETVAESGARKLLAGTQSRLFELQERSGVYRLLADGLGNPTTNRNEEECTPCAGARLRGAQLLGYAVFTNGQNRAIYYAPGQSVSGCDSKPVPDLVALGVTRVGVVQQFKGFMFYADITMDGVSYPGMVLHSDFNAPLELLPIGGSLARNLTIGFSERVLAFEPLGDYLMAYTDKGIWRGQLNIQYASGSEPAQVFSFTQVYSGPHALRYKYSLLNTGNEHLFGAVDGVYVLRSAFNAPERVEWVHRATGAIYEGLAKWSRELQDLPEGVELSEGPLNTAACDNFIGAYNPITSEVWFSWPTDNNTCANLSLRINVRGGYEHASLVDEGFSAFAYFRPDDRPTYEEWLLEMAGCETETPTQLESAATPPPYIWNAEEDPNGTIAPDSLCALLNGQTLDDICRQCEAAPVFIGASTRDLTLKELRDDVYYREFWNGTDYEESGYADFVQTIIGTLGSDVEKAFGGSDIPALVAEFSAENQTTPGDLKVQAGFGVSGTCMNWRDGGTRKLKCLNDEAKFPFYYRGRHLAFRMWTYGTGNGHCISRVDAHVKNIQQRG